MNELSWMIYAGSVAGDVNNVCGFVFYFGLIGLAIYAVGKGICRLANSDMNEPPVTPSIAVVGKALLIPVLAAGMIGIVTPEKDTLYAIAASEMGETFLNTETGGKAVAALNAWLEGQIADKEND